jgi:hypothetical protein
LSGDITDFYVHTVTVKPKLGTGAAGDVFGPSQTITGYLDGKTQLIRSANGEQVVSASQFYCSVADGAKFAPDSVVTFGDGRTAQVIIVNSLDAPGLELPEHAVIYLT